MEHCSVHISGGYGSLIMCPDQFRVTLSSFHASTLSETVDEVVYSIYFVSIRYHYSYYYLCYLIHTTNCGHRCHRVEDAERIEA